MHHSGGGDSAHTTTSLGVADAITRSNLFQHDLLLWHDLFSHILKRSVNEELAEEGRTIWNVTIGWFS